MSTNDVTGWCERREHEACSGILRTATGYSWWCACLCHPEPTPDDAAPMAPLGAVEKAITQWRSARKTLAALTDGDQ